MVKPAMGVLGATSMVGKNLLPLLEDAGWYVEAFSRQPQMHGQSVDEDAHIGFFRIMGKPEWFVNIPLFVFRSAIACLRALPRFRNWSAAMAERMSTDLIFDHTDAERDLGFSPKPFRLGKTDLPISGASNF